MKIMILCSKAFYNDVDKIKLELERNNIEVFLPNCYDHPDTENKMKNLGYRVHQEFKAKMFHQSEEIIKKVDGVLVLNFDKKKDGIVYKNYIGGATFLEMYDAFKLDKKIYLYNEIPDGILHDEIEGFDPIIITGNIGLVFK